MNSNSIVDILKYRATYEEKDNAYTFLNAHNQTENTLLYGELHSCAQKIAVMLQSTVEKGDRVVLIYQPGLEFVSAFFGCLYAGVIAVPAYPPRRNHSLSRLQLIISSSDSSAVLTTTDIMSILGSKRDELFQIELANSNLKWLTTDNLQEVSSLDWQEPSISHDTIACIQYTSGSTGVPKGVMLSHGNLYHNSTLIQQCFEHSPKSKGFIWLPPYHDMGLIGGIIQPLFCGFPVILMSPMDFLQNPFKWLQSISTYSATTSGGPNFAYDLCVQKVTNEEKASLDLSSWDLAFTGAEPVQAETIDAFSSAFAVCGFRRESFYPCYGMAETTLIASGGVKKSLPILKKFCKDSLEINKVLPILQGDDRGQTLVSCGRSKLNQQIIIAHPENLTRSLPDEVGEIWVSGDSVAQGYYSLPDETEIAFHAQLKDLKEDRFLRTGDLGFVHDSELFITGRLKDLIIVRGCNYYPQDIEKVAEKSHLALRENHGAVFAVNSSGQDKVVVAYEIKRSYLRNLNAEEVIKAIYHAVVEHNGVQLSSIVLLKTGSILKTSSGKIQRSDCRTRYLSKNLEVISEWSAASSEEETKIFANDELQNVCSATQPNNILSVKNLVDQQESSESVKSIQRWLIATIMEHLKSNFNEVNPETISITKSLSSYGFDSLAMAELLNNIERQFGCILSPNVFDDYPNIESLSRHLSLLRAQRIASEIDNLSDHEIDILLQKLSN
jgi:acyl-CoA synthetase (AMP-forming)/AMP-acid ligase II/acyl carrier protein